VVRDGPAVSAFSMTLSAALSKACCSDKEPEVDVSRGIVRFGGDVGGKLLGCGEGEEACWSGRLGVRGLSSTPSRDGVAMDDWSSSSMRFPIPTCAVSSSDVRVGVRSPPLRSSRPPLSLGSPFVSAVDSGSIVCVP